MTDPRVTFGVIVLNGEPFTRYNLRAVYPFAHEIIVVEGACLSAAAIATRDGHSTDGTLDVLQRFKEEEDPEDKLIIVTAEKQGKADGFWSEKDEMSQAYAARATGNYLWQVDIDEFYQPDDMKAILNALKHAPQLRMATFKQITFWGNLNYWVDGFLLRRGAAIYRRLFQWGPGYSYVSHRPPDVADNMGHRLSGQQVLCADRLVRRLVFLYHYSLLFPTQIKNKSVYYEAAAWAQARGAVTWAEQISQRITDPFRVHNSIAAASWLEEFRGEHPPQIQKMWDDISSGKVDVDLRPMDDVASLMHSHPFQIRRALLRGIAPIDVFLYRLRAQWANFRRRYGIFTPRMPIQLG